MRSKETDAIIYWFSRWDISYQHSKLDADHGFADDAFGNSCFCCRVAVDKEIEKVESAPTTASESVSAKDIFSNLSTAAVELSQTTQEHVYGKGLAHVANEAAKTS